MSHDLMFEGGNASMMYVDEPPWHGLGKKLDKPATAEEAIQAASLDWDVKKRPLFVDSQYGTTRVNNKFAVVRESGVDKECFALGVVGKDYRLLQNREAFEFFDPIVGQGAAVYHTAGALGDGERVWILAKLPGEIRVKGDDIANKYLLLSNSHDGSSAVQIKFTPIRVVCQNTLTMALSSGPAIRAHHCRNMQTQLRTAQNLIGAIVENFETIGLQFQRMAATPLPSKSAEAYFAAVFPLPSEPSSDANRESYERRKRRIQRHRDFSHKLFEEGKGNDIPGVRGTLWAAYNGVTEYVDHCMAATKKSAYPSQKQRDSNLKSAWFGNGYLTKARAYKQAFRFQKPY